MYTMQCITYVILLISGTNTGTGYKIFKTQIHRLKWFFCKLIFIVTKKASRKNINNHENNLEVKRS